MRGVFEIKPGAVVATKDCNQALLVKAWLDDSTVVVENLTTGFASNVPVLDLRAFEHKSPKVGDLFDLTPEQRKQSKYRYKAIEPLLGVDSRKAVEARAEELEVSVATLYRWLKAFKEAGVMSALVRSPRSDKGSRKLTEKQEELILLAIEEYLKEERPPVTEVYMFLRSLCRQQKVDVPDITTLRSRIYGLEEELRISKRYGKHTAFTEVGAKSGTFPDADYPYAVLQIDHKELDVVVVDDHYRIAVGRPWITVAIDVFSRIVAGYYLSFDAPSSLSVGMCLAMTILPKENLLSRYSIDGSWPCFGIPTKVHVDNAKEFRGEALAYGAEEYQIEIAFRKVKRPNYGGHIESLLGATFKSGMSTMPGKTFSNTVERGEYHPDEKAALTMGELDEWMLDFISNTYNQTKHSETLTPPVHKYTLGLLGTNEQPGPGRISVPVSGQRLLIDFLTILHKPVHRAGIVIDYIWYYDDALIRWINAKDPTSVKSKRKFIVRRDPRDISYVWFYDPDIKDYLRIPYRIMSRPAMSIWEYKAVRKWMDEQGEKAVDEATIFRSFDRRRKLIEGAVLKTKKARKEVQKARLSKSPLPSHEAVSPKPEPASRLLRENTEELVPEEPIEPFDEIELY